MLFEETTGTLLCGDLFSHLGRPRPLTDDDIVERRVEAEDMFRADVPHADTAPTIRRLADLSPTTWR